MLHLITGAFFLGIDLYNPSGILTLSVFFVPSLECPKGRVRCGNFSTYILKNPTNS